MKTIKRAQIWAGVVSVLIAVNSYGQTLTVLHDFTSEGVHSTAPLVLSGNTLFGSGWNYSNGGGIVFSIGIDGSNFIVLHIFNAPNSSGWNSDGAYFFGGLILSSNTLYGTACYGGTNGIGTVFSMNATGSNFTVLHTFQTGLTAPINISTITNMDGGLPYAGLVLSGITLYGTTGGGGSNAVGTVFSMNTDGSGFTTLHSFSGNDGAGSQAALVLSGNVLYGTTASGGANGNGTIFSIATNGGNFTTLYNFTARDAPHYTNGDGSFPAAPLLLSANTLYGTTVFGGTGGVGAVFSVNTNGSGFNVLHYSDIPGGLQGRAGLTLSSNILYGTTAAGGTGNDGTVFSVNIDGSGYAVLHSFSAQDGANPEAGLILLVNTFYGTTAGSEVVGGPCGTVFSFSPNAPTIIFEPQNLTITNGDSASFKVYASGAPLLSYQWQWNGTNIVGAIKATLNLTNVQYTSAGNYSVIVSNSYGAAISSNADLTVLVFSPSIGVQPTNQAAIVGTDVTFAVEASGTPPLNYQWAFNATNIVDATNETLTLDFASTASAGLYTVTITNAYGSITSNPAMLTVLPLVLTAPQVLTNGQFQFSFNTITGVDYSIQYSTTLTDWTPLVTFEGYGGLITIITPNAVGSTQCFYRISLSPQ